MCGGLVVPAIIQPMRGFLLPAAATTGKTGHRAGLTGKIVSKTNNSSKLGHATGSIVLAVHPSMSADELRPSSATSRRPGEINYGSPGFATPHHLAMELFKHATGTDLLDTPYKGRTVAGII